MFKANTNALEKAGVRDDVAVLVGGAPVTWLNLFSGRDRQVPAGWADVTS
ncbi:MAG: hypothetical protein WAK93_04155 [Solirubrobacteraceae bacterium]